MKNHLYDRLLSYPQDSSISKVIPYLLHPPGLINGKRTAAWRMAFLIIIPHNLVIQESLVCIIIIIIHVPIVFIICFYIMIIRVKR